MTWEDVENANSISKREKLEEKYYIEQVKILDWLKTEGDQKIRFLDRIEYKVDGKPHRLDGPAVEPIEGNPTGTLPLEEYWINGEKFSDHKEWLPVAQRLDRKLKLERVKGE